MRCKSRQSLGKGGGDRERISRIVQKEVEEPQMLCYQISKRAPRKRHAA